MRVHVTRKQREKNGLREIERHTDADVSGGLSGNSRDIFPNSLCICDQRFGLLVAGLARVSQLECARGAVDQLAAEIPFECGDSS